MATYQFKQFRQLHLQLVLAHWNEPWLTQADLAKRFDISQAWCSQILTSPEAKAITAQLMDRSIDTIMDVQTQLQAIAPAALKERIDLAMDRSGRVPMAVKDRALNALLEMAGHSPVKRLQVDRPDETQPWRDKTDAEIRDELLKVVAVDRGPDGKLVN